MPKHASNDSVAERRLRPIYDWLDNGNNKRALQEADKLMRKHPEFECCQALRCLALMRLGREGEATQVLDKLLAVAPVDEGALNAMTIAFRELQEPAKICRMYEGAVGREPGNEELLSHLFMSYVRVGEYKKQEEAARNLYKAKPKNPYFFWSVMSLVLQATEGDARLGQAVHLPLAHRKVAKMAADGKMDQEQEVLLFLLVLELREAWAEGLEVLEGAMGEKLAKSASYRTFCRSKRLEFLKALGRWEEVARLAREEVEGAPDQWAAYTHYLTAVRRLGEGEGAAPEGLTRGAAVELVRHQQEEHGGLRGPWLAELELVAVLGEESEASAPALILQYFDKFGSKHVAFSDLKPYLGLVGEERRQELVLELAARWAGEPTNHAEIYRDVNLAAMRRFAGLHRRLTEEQAGVEVAALVARWRAVQPLVADLLPTDLRPSDSYLVLAAHILWDLWLASGTTSHLLRAATILHLGAAASPSNWQMKLLLVRLYCAAGSAGAAAAIHAGLDIKHLMLDSLGWLLPRHLCATGHLELAVPQLSATVRLYNHVNKDTADHIITAYRSGTFYQIRDIYRLRTRVTQSHHFASVDTEHVLLQLLEVEEQAGAGAVLGGLELELAAEAGAWEGLRDNRDLATMVTWDPVDMQVGEEQVKESFRLEVLFARCRHLLLRSVAASLLVVEDPSNAPLLPALPPLLSSLRAHWSSCLVAVQGVAAPLVRPQAPDVPRLVPYSLSGQLLPLLHLMDTLPLLLAPALDPAPALASLRAAAKLLAGVGGALGVPACAGSLTARREVLELLMFGVETVGLAAILLAAVAQAMGVPAARAKKGKKGKAAVSPAFLPLVPDFVLVKEAVGAAVGRLGAGIQELETVLKDSNLADSLELLGLAVEEGRLGEAVEEGEEGKEVLARMEASYTSSLRQMTAVLERKGRSLAAIGVTL